MSDIKIGSPTPIVSPPRLCETKVLPFELVNTNAPGGANIATTLAAIIVQAVAGATTNGITFSGAVAISGTGNQVVSQASVCAGCIGQRIRNDAGVLFPVLVDDAGVIISPNGGTNQVALSCKGECELGNGNNSCNTRLDPDDVVTLVPGAGLIGQISVCRCTKAGVEVDPTVILS